MNPKAPANMLIIGGGLAGLTAAVHTALSGMSVLVFERSQRIGGRARSTRHEKFTFNLDPRALYQKGAAATTLRAYGVEWTSGWLGMGTYAGGLAVGPWTP